MKVVEDQVETYIPGVHYLIQHAVVQQDKTITKLCTVYETSAKMSGPSLNDC